MNTMIIKIEWSESNNGYLMDVFKDSEMEDSLDGGLCTGTMKDAIKWASEMAINQINKHG